MKKLLLFSIVILSLLGVHHYITPFSFAYTWDTGQYYTIEPGDRCGAGAGGSNPAYNGVCVYQDRANTIDNHPASCPAGMNSIVAGDPQCPQFVGQNHVCCIFNTGVQCVCSTNVDAQNYANDQVARDSGPTHNQIYCQGDTQKKYCVNSSTYCGFINNNAYCGTPNASGASYCYQPGRTGNNLNLILDQSGHHYCSSQNFACYNDSTNVATCIPPGPPTPTPTPLAIGDLGGQCGNVDPQNPKGGICTASYCAPNLQNSLQTQCKPWADANGFSHTAFCCNANPTQSINHCSTNAATNPDGTIANHPCGATDICGNNAFCHMNLNSSNNANTLYHCNGTTEIPNVTPTTCNTTCDSNPNPNVCTGTVVPPTSTPIPQPTPTPVPSTAGLSGKIYGATCSTSSGNAQVSIRGYACQPSAGANYNQIQVDFYNNSYASGGTFIGGFNSEDNSDTQIVSDNSTTNCGGNTQIVFHGTLPNNGQTTLLNGQTSMNLYLSIHAKNGSPVLVDKDHVTVTCSTPGGATPTPSPTPVPNAPTPTPNPVDNNTPTPIPGNPQNTSMSVNVHMDGIDPTNLGGQQPIDLSRKLTLYFYDVTKGKSATQNDWQGNNATKVATDIVTYQSGVFGSQNFSTPNLPSGTYYVFAKAEDGSLREELFFQTPNTSTTSDTIAIVTGQNNVLNTSATPLNLRMGDIQGTGTIPYEDNAVGSGDYGALISCYGAAVNGTSKQVPGGCADYNANPGVTTKNTLYSDLNDDGYVNGIDYNILLRNFNKSGL